MIRPWDLVHRGRVRARGLRVDPAGIGEAAAHRRILEHWVDGDRVTRSGRGWIVRFGTERLLPDPPPGEPLVEREGVLLGAPLRDVEWADRPAGTVLAAVGGALGAHDDGAIVDPSTWIAVDVPVLDVWPLGPPPRPIPASLDPVPGLGGSERALSDGPTLAAVREALAGAVPPEPEAPAEDGAWARLQRWVGATAREPGEGVGAPTGAAPPSGSGGLGGWLERTMARALYGMGLGGEVERRHQRTLEELLARFDQDLDEALRRAVPLGGDAGGARWHPSLRASPPRSSLSPSTSAGAASGSIGASGTLYDSLKQAYLAAAQTLEAAGDVEKAAFVLSDLLRDIPAAVDLLERHERWELAARLWEGRTEASRERAVRLWFRAGDARRAIRLAHAHQVFGAAIAQLEGRPDDQRALRAAWAAHLVGAGRLGAAVEAVWPDPALRSGARPWLQDLVTRGGPAAADVLERWSELDPEGAQEALDARLASDHPEDRALRRRLAVVLGRDAPPGWSRALARRLLIDADPEGADAFKRLADRPENLDLRADAPPFPAADPGPGLEQLSGEPGTTPVLDAFPLPHGLLCALGEAGLAFLDRDGRVVWRDPTPADQLVGDPESTRVLAVAGGSAQVARIARVDTARLHAEPWVQLPLVAWARTHLAGRWVVSDRERDRVLDLTGPTPTWLWQGPDREGRSVRGIHVDPASVCIARTGPDELWRYSPTMGYRRRDPYEPGDPLVVHQDQVLSATRGAGPIWTREGASRVLELPDAPTWGDRAVYDGSPLCVDLWGDRAMVVRSRGDRSVFDVFGPDGRVSATVGIDAPGVRVRASASGVLLFDGLGRIWELSLTPLRVRRTGRV